MRSFLVMVALAGCAGQMTDDTSDTEAESAPVQADGKADGANLSGLFVSHAKTHYNNDIPALQLRAEDYIRARCYHASCALRLPETDKLDAYTSSSGKTYLRFWSFSVARDANGELQPTPVIADVYEVQTTSTGIKLRKSFTSRWFTLYATSEDALCTGTGGTWNGTDCACPGNIPGQFATHEFVAGAGGCIDTPGASEDGCDSSDGLWTDDDATPIGSFCECGVGRYDDANGSCAAI
jgi:hypothetical protein